MSTVTLEQAKALLESCNRNELRDHAFGDREVMWVNPETNDVVAEGYFGRTGSGVTLNTECGGKAWYGEDASVLAGCGMLGKVCRNDETGPDKYAGC